MEERRRTFWAILLAPMLLAGLAATPARADILVNRLNQEPVASNDAAPSCTVTQEQAKAQPPTSEAPEPATLLSALVGTGLAGLFAAFRRKRLAGADATPTV
jgi:hypothetical protein